MKIHPILIDKIILALDTIFEEKKYADKVLEKTFKQNKQFGARDRKFIAEAVYECVKHYRFFQHVAVGDQKINGFKQLANSSKNSDVVAVYLVQKHGDLPKHSAFSRLNVEQITARLRQPVSDEIKYSFPAWMYKMGLDEFKNEWPALMKALNEQAPVHLRVNSLKISRDELVKKLNEEGIVTEKDLLSEVGLTLVERKNVFTTEAFKRGFFEVQDISSQMIAPLLQIEPGVRVVDACAGAGGKSLHIASLMKNKGKLISMDIFQWKLDELKKRAARNGVDVIETKLIDSTKVTKRLEGSFDRVLLDVPCSGMGVLRRNPDTKWKLTLDEIQRLMNLQKEILADYSRMCKSGGIMVYATCSILHRENEDQVKWFLTESAEKDKWDFIKDLRLWPHKEGYDGFYAAVFKKK